MKCFEPNGWLNIQGLLEEDKYMINDFYKYDTILAVRYGTSISHKGFLLKEFQSRLYDSWMDKEHTGKKRFVKNLYMVKYEDKQFTFKKFYGKKSLITVFTTRIVLTEKINFNKIQKKLDFL